MSKSSLWPKEEVIEYLFEKTPKYMGPSRSPYVVSINDYISHTECDLIKDKIEFGEKHIFPECGSLSTTEFEGLDDPCFSNVVNAVKNANDICWEYDIFPINYAYGQVYTEGCYYRHHMDGNIGQTRKLTGLVLLSHPDEYDGGELYFTPPSGDQYVPELAKGTILVFPHWLQHCVAPVKKGVRYSLNVGVWGPPFK